MYSIPSRCFPQFLPRLLPDPSSFFQISKGYSQGQTFGNLQLSSLGHDLGSMDTPLN